MFVSNLGLNKIHKANTEGKQTQTPLKKKITDFEKGGRLLACRGGELC